jgi:hypothetical protein
MNQKLHLSFFTWAVKQVLVTIAQKLICSRFDWLRFLYKNKLFSHHLHHSDIMYFTIPYAIFIQ